MDGVVIQKYGGSSLRTIDQLNTVAGCIADAHRSGQLTVIVVSARSDTTDNLINLAGEICGDRGNSRTAREIDQLLATGECASAAQMALALDRIGVAAISFTGGQCGISVIGKHGAGVINEINTDRILRMLDEGNVVVVAGFHGVSFQGDVVTLGRGGSDTTAVALTIALGARCCKIFTDVGGVYTADPHVVAAARILPVIDMSMMTEMAFSGARILHSRAVELAALHGIELHVGSSSSQKIGTMVIEGRGTVLETQSAALAITHDTGVASVLMHSRCGRNDPTAVILTALADRSIPVDQVARFASGSDAWTIGFTVSSEYIQELIDIVQRVEVLFDIDLTVDESVGKVSLVGTGLLNRPEYMMRILSTLASAKIPVGWISTSQLRASVTVPPHRIIEAVEILHREFELNESAASLRSMLPACLTSP